MTGRIGPTSASKTSAILTNSTAPKAPVPTRSSLRLGEIRQGKSEMRIPDHLDRIPWLAAGYHELQTGVARYGTVGDRGEYVPVYDAEHHIRNNPRILEYFTATTLHTKKESTSWCSAFVNWCMRQSGIAGTRSAAARSWLKWH